MTQVLMRSTAVGCLLLCGACGNKDAPSEGAFKEAISRHLAENGELCLGLTFRQWPLDLAVAQYPSEVVWLMNTLEGVGLLSGEETTAEGKNVFGKPSGVMQKIKRFQLTDAGKSFYRERLIVEKPAPGFGKNATDIVVSTVGDFCYGHMVLKQVVKWEAPINQRAAVTYTYKIDGLAPWAKDVSVKQVFTRVAGALNGEGTKEMPIDLKLTSNGWDSAIAN